MRTQIYYFSGTGNCLAVAKQIAQEYEGAEVVAICDKLLQKNEPIRSDNLFIVYPSYGYGMPAMLHRFLKTADIQADYIGAITTYGSQYGATLLYAKQILKKRGIKINYFGGIKAVENYIPIFGLSDEQTLQKKIEWQAIATEALVDDLKEKKQNDVRSFKPFSKMVSTLFRGARRLLAKGIKFTDDCTRCGICRDICPGGAIDIPLEGKPVICAKKCEHCQACLNWCPKKAIKFAKLKPHTRRYRHPDVALTELKKR